jgi:hypothetical protein
MSSDLTVTANFLSHSPKQQYRLLVTRLGNGTITSDDDKIACPADCNEKYDEGTTIGCSGDTCTVTMNRAKTVMAVFARDNKR